MTLTRLRNLFVPDPSEIETAKLRAMAGHSRRLFIVAMAAALTPAIVPVQDITPATQPAKIIPPWRDMRGAVLAVPEDFDAVLDHYYPGNRDGGLKENGSRSTFT